MRVLVDGSGAIAGAAGMTRLRELARTFPELRPRDEFVFVVRPELAPAVLDVAPGASLWTVPPAFGRAPLRLAWQCTGLPRRARRFEPDVLLAPFNIAPRVPGVPMALMISNLAPYADSVRIRSSRRQRARNGMLRVLTDRSIRRADRVLLLTRQGTDLIDTPGFAQKAVVLPRPPPPAPPPANVDDSLVPDEAFLLVVGDLYGFKGVETVIEALALLDEPPLLLVCGQVREQAYGQELKRLAEAAGVTQRVRWLGSVQHDSVLALMRRASVSVAASRFEALSRIPSEAMSAGTPIVACDIASYREAAGDGALYYDEDDAAGLARHLKRLLGDPEFHAERGRLGRSLAMDEGPGSVPEAILATLEALARAQP